MQDKPPVEQSAEQKAPTPKRPPKELPQDYSSLPQKPIKLKSDVTLPPALKQNPGKSATAKQAIPKPARKAKRKPSTQAPKKTLDGVSPQVREIALAAAAEQGLELTDWLEQLILNSQQAPEMQKQTGHGEIMQSLQMIERRLQRIEHQRGFWSRFWEQFMEPYRHKP
jgi:hypothetical protein